MTATTESRATTERLQIQDSAGSNTMLTAGPIHVKPISDDLVLAVVHRTYAQGRSILLSQAKARELHEWLGRWLEHGWPGVPRQEGPTSADVIKHYQDIAIRERIAADHVRSDCGREVDAALALIPVDKRSVDLVAVARAQSELWHRITAERDALEQTRLSFLTALHEMADAKGATADQLRAVAGKVSARHAHPKVKPVPDPVPNAPVYRHEQLDLFAGTEFAA